MNLRVRSVMLATAFVASAALVVPATATATPGAAPPAATVTRTAAATADPAPDTREATKQNLPLDGKQLKVPARYQAPTASSKRSAADEVTPPVGTVRQWLGRDDAQGTLYRKDYTLRGVGDKIEVWVANDIAFPAGDCRLAVPSSTEVTDAQVSSLVQEFDTNMFPKESQAFSVAPDRDGSNALLGPDRNGNGGVYTGNGDKIVTLVDNVRDANYYTFPAAPTYIAGFFSSQFNELFDRNVMTIDAYDWLHRTGANPPNEPTSDPCTSRPARPRLYEGTFAHEYQHLLQYYIDPFETTAVNEGLSDFAQTLVGYVDSRRTVYQRGGDSHLYCFQGYGTVMTPFNTNPRDCGGPENSFNLWNESPNPNAVLADYGNAYSLMLFLYDRYGTDFISALHRDAERQGLDSIGHLLEAEGTDLYTVLHDYQSMVLLDKLVGDAPTATLQGTTRKRVTTPSLRSSVNLGNPAAYATPGAAPNGADYVRLKGRGGGPLKGSNLTSLRFEGAATLPALPLLWSVVTDDPDRPGNPVLWSGNANSLDAAAVTPVDVPTTDPTLRFLAKYGAEAGYDYAYVEVSTDGGATYTPVAGDKTVPGPFGPALNGTTDGFEAHTFDLSAYAGQSVLLSFRYVSDGGVNEGGLLVDDVTLGSTTVSDGSSLAAFRSPSQIRPTPVANWSFKVVGVTNGSRPAVVQLQHNGRSSVTLTATQRAKLAGSDYLVAIVSYDEPTELVQQYAPYSLTVNGVLQDGGS